MRTDPSGKIAGATVNGEGHHDAVAYVQLLDIASDLDDLTHWLMAKNVTLLRRQHIPAVEVKVGATDGRGGDFHDRIARINDLRVGHGIDSDIFCAVPAECFHKASMPKVGNSLQ
jgi:hypothetical protein